MKTNDDTKKCASKGILSLPIAFGLFTFLIGPSLFAQPTPAKPSTAWIADMKRAFASFEVEDLSWTLTSCPRTGTLPLKHRIEVTPHEDDLLKRLQVKEKIEKINCDDWKKVEELVASMEKIYKTGKTSQLSVAFSEYLTNAVYFHERKLVILPKLLIRPIRLDWDEANVKYSPRGARRGAAHEIGHFIYRALDPEFTQSDISDDDWIGLLIGAEELQADLYALLLDLREKDNAKIQAHAIDCARINQKQPSLKVAVQVRDFSDRRNEFETLYTKLRNRDEPTIDSVIFYQHGYFAAVRYHLWKHYIDNAGNFSDAQKRKFLETTAEVFKKVLHPMVAELPQDSTLELRIKIWHEANKKVIAALDEALSR